MSSCTLAEDCLSLSAKVSKTLFVTQQAISVEQHSVSLSTEPLSGVYHTITVPVANKGVENVEHSHSRTGGLTSHSAHTSVLSTPGTLTQQAELGKLVAERHLWHS